MTTPGYARYSAVVMHTTSPGTACKVSCRPVDPFVLPTIGRSGQGPCPVRLGTAQVVEQASNSGERDLPRRVGPGGLRRTSPAGGYSETMRAIPGSAPARSTPPAGSLSALSVRCLSGYGEVAREAPYGDGWAQFGRLTAGTHWLPERARGRLVVEWVTEERGAREVPTPAKPRAVEPSVSDPVASPPGRDPAPVPRAREPVAPIGGIVLRMAES